MVVAAKLITVRLRVLILIVSSVLLLPGAGNGATPNTASLTPTQGKAAGSRVSMVFEPVFKGAVLVSESGVGNPRTVILIHGIGEDLCARAWDGLIPELSARYHVVTFDLPGFCHSTKQNTLYSPDLYADFIKWVADRYAQGKYIVVGHSMGGAIALKFAAKYPADLEQLIVVDAAGILHRAAFTKFALQVNPRPDSLPFRELASRFANTLSGYAVDRAENLNPLNVTPLISNGFVREKVFGADPVKIAAVSLLQEDFSQALDRIMTPTLLIWGSDDDVAPLRTAKVLRAKLTRSRLEVIDDAGHSPMLSRPEEFNRVVIDEIDRKEPPAMAKGRRSDPPPGKARRGRCRNQEDMLFSGRYSTIDIDGCNRVRMNDVTAEALAVSASKNIVIENSSIKGKGVGLKVESSQLTLTDVLIDAGVAVSTSNSSLDLAGVELIGVTAAATTTDSSSLIFSVSKVKSPHASGYLHGLYNITPEKPL